MANELYNSHTEATGGVDLQIPAILKALEKLNLKLKGDKRVAIGTWGHKKGLKYIQISWTLSPFKVPLWCDNSLSVEAFWQNYKYLAIKENQEQLSIFENNNELSKGILKFNNFTIIEEYRDLFDTDKETYVYEHCIAKDYKMGAGIVKIFDNKDLI